MGGWKEGREGRREGGIEGGSGWGRRNGRKIINIPLVVKTGAR
jgi:hypothetical protein